MIGKVYLKRGGGYDPESPVDDPTLERVPLFYIQDTRSVCGNSASWWREGGHGYTSNLDEAWKVPGTWEGRETDALRPCDKVDALAQRHFDVQKLRDIE